MSSVNPMIGILAVACCAARIPKSPPAANHIDARLDELRSKTGNKFNLLPILTPIDREVLAFDEAGPAKFFGHRDVLRCPSGTRE
jgi:hypothetical protein